eukprot:13492494-Heterocapsa_arctica.AAC.1
MPLITEDEVRRVVNNLADGKAKGIDGWSPAELRALSRTQIKGLTDILNKVEKYERWPHGLHPITALIAKEGAENEGQLRPIAILPYADRVWMAVRKSSQTMGHEAQRGTIQFTGNPCLGNCGQRRIGEDQRQLFRCRLH